jgi:hypothetical protein
MDQIPLEFTIHLLLDDYLDLIDYLKKHKTLKYYGEEADKQLDKHIDNF